MKAGQHPERQHLELELPHDRRIVRVALKTAWATMPPADRARIDELLERLKTPPASGSPPPKIPATPTYR